MLNIKSQYGFYIVYIVYIRYKRLCAVGRGGALAADKLPGVQ